MKYIDSIASLIAEFSKLPGVGQRTAYRYAYCIMNMSEEEVKEFADTIIDVKRKVHYCKLCGNYSETG
jgi:recombination protein RecR